MPSLLPRVKLPSNIGLSKKNKNNDDLFRSFVKHGSFFALANKEHCVFVFVSAVVLFVPLSATKGGLDLAR